MMNTFTTTPVNDNFFITDVLRLKQQAEAKRLKANPQALATQTQTMDVLGGMPYYVPVTIQQRQGMDFAKDFTGVALGALSKISETRIGKAVWLKMEGMLAGFTGLELPNPEREADLLKLLASQTELKNYAAANDKSYQIRQKMIDAPIKPGDTQASMLRAWITQLTKSGSATLADLQEHLNGEQGWFDGSLDMLMSLPVTFLHTQKGTHGWDAVHASLVNIRNTPRELYQQPNTPEGKQANKEIETAISAMLGMAGNAESSELFRWAGHFGAIVLLLRKGETDLHRVPEQIYKMETMLGKALTRYHYMKQKLPAMFPNTTNGAVGLDLQDVLHRLPSKADEQTAKNQVEHTATDYEKAFGDFGKAVNGLIEKEHKYVSTLQAHHSKEAKGDATAKTTGGIGLHDVLGVIDSFNHAKDKLTEANNAIIAADNIRHLASIRPEELKAAVEARQFFEEWEEQMVVGGHEIPDIVENHHSVVRYFQAVKSQFFYSVVAMMLKKQMDTLPLDKVEVLLEKGLGALEASQQQPWQPVVKELLTLRQPLVMEAEVVKAETTPLFPLVDVKEASFEQFKVKIQPLSDQIQKERPQTQLAYDNLAREYKQLEKQYLEETQPEPRHCIETGDYLGMYDKYQSPATKQLLAKVRTELNNHAGLLNSQLELSEASQELLQKLGNYSWHPTFKAGLWEFVYAWNAYKNQLALGNFPTTLQRVRELTEQLEPLLEKMLIEEADNSVITTNSQNTIQQTETHSQLLEHSVVLQLLKNATEHLQDAYLGLAPEQATALKNAKTLLNLNNLFGLSKNFTEAQKAKLEQLTEGNKQYQQGLQNLRMHYSQQLEQALAVALDREPPATPGELYEALIEGFNTQVRQEAYQLEAKKNEAVLSGEATQRLSPAEYQTLIYKKQLMAQIPTLQQLHALASEDLTAFVNLNLPS